MQQPTCMAAANEPSPRAAHASRESGHFQDPPYTPDALRSYDGGMNPAKIARFGDSERYFICPICHDALHLDGTSLRCADRHTFDIAKQGYVNLMPAAKQSPFYNKESFANRARILEAGYYDHIRDAVLDAIPSTADFAGLCSGERPAILDVGCGEGFYSRAVQRANPQVDVLAFDISKDSIQQAAREDTGMAVKWFVGNLADLPVRDGAIDCVLDVFSPINTAEFHRVMKDDAVVVKVVPGTHHDEQLRELAREQLRNTDYSNEHVIEQFCGHFDVLSMRTVSQTLAMPPADVSTFAHMTPLLFNVDIDALDLTQISELTIEARIIVARK